MINWEHIQLTQTPVLPYLCVDVSSGAKSHPSLSCGVNRSCLFLHSLPIAGQAYWDFLLRRAYYLLVIPAIVPLDVWLSHIDMLKVARYHYVCTNTRWNPSWTCRSGTSPSCSTYIHPQESAGRTWGLNWSIIEMSSPLSSQCHT